MTDYVELRLEHMPRLADFCNRNFEYHRGRFAAEPLRRTIFDDPDHRGGHGFLLLDGEDVVGVMVGVQRGDEAWLKLFAVDKSRRRSRIASGMLGEIEGRFRAVGVKRVHTLNSSPCYAMPGQDVRYTESFCLLQERGYRLDKYVHNMEVDLGANDLDTSESESGLAVQGIFIRRMDHDDEPALRPWVHRNWGSSWATETCNGLRNSPVTTHVAVKDGNIVGFAIYDVMVLTDSFGPTGLWRRANAAWDWARYSCTGVWAI